MLSARLLVLALLVAVACGGVTNVVVVMLENNSFDRIFGTNKRLASRGTGLTGREYNTDLLGRRVYPADAKHFVPGCNPDHSVQATTSKIFGFPVPDFSNASMSGFVRWEEAVKQHTNGCNTLHVFNDTALPVMNFLAEEGVLFDSMFSSVPGPTWPNRWFTLMATSGGLTDTGDWNMFQTGRLFPQRTIFDQIHDAGLTWRYYFQTTPWELCLAGVLHNPDHLFHFDQFLADAEAGTLPSFSWINPRSGVDAETGLGSNDDHPEHDMALGEQFLADIYQAVRNSPQWNTTALIVMFDEHGGFADFMPPPSKDVPAPDSFPGVPIPFGFTRLGVRVPFVVVSPWVPRSLIVSRPPPAQRPFPSSEYEHTSVMATVRKLLNITEGPLTKRDAWAGTFEHIFSLSQPRTDLPLSAPSPPSPTLEGEGDLPLTDLQLDLLRMHAAISRAHFRPPPLQRDLHLALTRHFKHAVSKVRAHDAAYRLVVQAEPGQAFLRPKSILDDEWIIAGNHRIASRRLQYQNTSFCFTDDGSGNVSVQLCRNASQLQIFDLHNDGSIRNAAGLCVTAVRQTSSSNEFFGVYSLQMQTCTGAVFQSFSYYGNNAPGAQNDSCNLAMGDGQGFFTIIQN